MNISISSLERSLYSKKFLYFQSIMIFFWGSQLLNSDAYYVNYLLLLIIASICCYYNIQANVLFKKQDRYLDIIMIVFSIVFSCMVTFSNYKVWSFGSVFTYLNFVFF